MDWTALAKPFVDWFPDRNKVLFAFSVIAALALFLPWTVLCALHVEGFAGAHRPAEWLIFVFCVLILLAEGAHKMWGHSRAHLEIDRHLRQMTIPQRGIVARLLDGEQMLKWTHEDGVEELRRLGILWREPSAWNRENNQWVYGLEKTAKDRAIALGIGREK